jgi:hypothetical protein
MICRALFANVSQHVIQVPAHPAQVVDEDRTIGGATAGLSSLDVLTVSEIYWLMEHYEPNNQEDVGELGLFSPACSSCQSAVARHDAK